MAPSPEYDKEPKAPDKSATNISSEDPKVLHNLVNDQQINSDFKPTNTTASAEVENNKHVETLDDGQLRALLDEAITYKCPKDREGKSILFKELLEEVEQDEQECEARGRRALPHSNSLQDLVAALAAEPQPRHRHHRHHAPAPAPAPANVSARAIHGGSLPSGVNTSSMVSEEPVGRGAGYLATVRCVNPPPLAERRVSASDANAPHEMDLLNRRSKPMFPMTYTARATLEIGSGSVCSGRAVTTTTASNQVRKPPSTATSRRHSHPSTPVAHTSPPSNSRPTPSTPTAPETNSVASQIKLMSALYPKAKCDVDGAGGGRGEDRAHGARARSDVIEGKEVPRGPNASSEDDVATRAGTNTFDTLVAESNEDHSSNSQWVDNVNKWYEGLTAYSKPDHEPKNDRTCYIKNYEDKFQHPFSMIYYHRDIDEFNNIVNTDPNIAISNIALGNSMQNYDADLPYGGNSQISKNVIDTNENKIESLYSNDISQDDGKALRVNILKNSDKLESDIRLRKQYRERIGKGLVVPGLAPINPKNIRSMSIGKPSTSFVGSKPIVTGALCNDNSNNEDNCSKVINKLKQKSVKGKNKYKKIKNIETPRAIEMTDIPNMKETSKDIELVEVSCSPQGICNSESFSQYCANQQKLMQVLESRNVLNEVSTATTLNEPDSKAIPTFNDEAVPSDSHEDCEVDTNVQTIDTEQKFIDRINSESVENEVVVQINKNSDGEVAGDRYVLAELPNNAYVFLTLPKRLLTPLNTKDERPSLQLHEIENNNNVKPYFPEETVKYTKKKKEQVSVDHSNVNSKKNDSINRNALRILLFENLFKSDRAKSVSDKPGVSSIADNEVDSAIPFSCITTPEVVTSCNTTSSSSQLAVAADPKPLQLDERYAAVGSVTGDCEVGRPSRGPAPACARVDRRDRLVITSPDHLSLQPRSVISNTFNGLPLSRPNYGSTGSSAPEDFKKSIDENGNSVQGFSSPLSGSSQHKKPRRKKSSKNETVIDCEKIDGYQGDKDVNELLRFIESNVESARGHKLGRAKHKDDSDDKSKKRSTERRKDKETKLKRASSLEELSRTKLEDLTDAPEPPLRPDKKERRADHATPKPERRSWGDDARDAFCYRPPDPAPAAVPTPATVELTDFQTVTKRRKPRRRPDDADPNPPPRRLRHSHAPPSDRSNDSNDDLDSVHSLPDPAPPNAAPRAAPPPPPPLPPQASYADIARTRHNIPDLIESCNFYAEGEAPGEPRRAPDPPPPAPADVDGYPALEPRAAPAPAPAAPSLPAAPRRPRDKPAAPPRRPTGKERAAPPPPEPESPAPDVVGERRPPVILLDSAAQPRDMDGVTFGFDINEQLLGDGVRRPRCDLVRDALEAPAAAPTPAPGLALRYLPPDPPAHSPHLHQIVDYVGAAWEDVMRCGGGKVRYYSE